MEKQKEPKRNDRDLGLCRHCKFNDADFIDCTSKGGYKYGSCNECNTKRHRKYSKENPSIIKEIVTRYELKNKPKRAAWAKLAEAVKTGKVVKPEKCEMCGKKKNLDGHHEDYDKALDVRWWCRRCHKEFHKGEKTGGRILK